MKNKKLTICELGLTTNVQAEDKANINFLLNKEDLKTQTHTETHTQTHTYSY